MMIHSVLLGLSALLCTASVAIPSTTTPLSNSGELSSTNASYDGNSLLLTGHVVLDHGLGKMTAEEASLQKQEEAGKDFPFALIQLRKEVLLALKNSAQMRCENADLDFSALKGILTAKANEKVAYLDRIKRKRSQELSSLEMLSEQLELKFCKQEHDGRKAEYEVDTILAKNDVSITYDEQFRLSADHALYRKQLPSDNKAASREFQGIITAYPKDNLSKCHLTHEGDLIDADTIDLDLLNSRIAMLHPKGSLIQHMGNVPMHFQCDHLTWDHLKNLLLMKGNVHIEDAAFGTIVSNDSITLEHRMINGKRLPQMVHSKGPTQLTYLDRENGGKHLLRCYGDIHLNHDQLQATLDSPPVTDGQVPHTQQLYYEENEIACYADQATLDYSLNGDTLQPSSLALKGNIRLFSHDPQKPIRCGTADRLHYSLTTQTLILSANPGKKVLFWDDVQGMQISAREVHITQDPETRQQAIKGVGNVQFALNTEELSFLKQLFPHLPVNHE